MTDIKLVVRSGDCDAYTLTEEGKSFMEDMGWGTIYDDNGDVCYPFHAEVIDPEEGSIYINLPKILALGGLAFDIVR